MPTRYGYTGREQDEYTGLYYYRARFYDPQIGRFISEDPIGFRGGINWYAYVGNNPLGFTDPLGLMGADNGFSHLPQYEIQKRIEQCKAIRILLERERMHGTGPASWISSVTFGSPDTMLTALNNRHYGNISVGGRPFDMDWFMDSKAVSGQFWDLGPFAYVVGKVSWSAKNKLTGQPQTYPWPYQDPGELEAALALSNNKSYKDIFTEEWFKEYCPCE
jgi:RHS repeat-associated protein